MINKPKHGHRVMVLTGHREHDTIDCVGSIGTIVGIYSDHPTTKDHGEFCIAVRLNSRIRHDVPMLFRTKDLTSSNPKGK